MHFTFAHCHKQSFCSNFTFDTIKHMIYWTYPMQQISIHDEIWRKTGIKVCYGIDILSGHVIFETWL